MDAKCRPRPQRRAVLLAWLAACAVCFAAAAAAADIDSDLRSGRAAYQAGDFASAMAQLRPLALVAHDPDAEYLVGMMYSAGQGVPRNPHVAAQWYEAAARQGHADAAFALAFLLYEGSGDVGNPNAVRADPAAAAPWMAQAAQHGNPTAQYLLGHMFRTGTGATYDKAAAQYWLLQAANQDTAAAQFELGLLFASEAGYQNAVEAYKWFEIATRARYPGAAQNRRVVGERLNGREIKRATELANGWRPGY